MCCFLLSIITLQRCCSLACKIGCFFEVVVLKTYKTIAVVFVFVIFIQTLIEENMLELCAETLENDGKWLVSWNTKRSVDHRHIQD